jgi:hypothetical protein
MKKWTKAILMAVGVSALALSLAACNGGENPADTTPGEVADDDPAYWDGFDFGQNLSYAEEYVIQSDPGDYMSAAEAAKLTFDSAKLNDYIPGYSDDTEYTMTLIDLADIDGEECYVYRCEGSDFTAELACAYQIDDIYMQDQSGQWERLDIQ